MTPAKWRILVEDQLRWGRPHDVSSLRVLTSPQNLTRMSSPPFIYKSSNYTGWLQGLLLYAEHCSCICCYAPFPLSKLPNANLIWIVSFNRLQKVGWESEGLVHVFFFIRPQRQRQQLRTAASWSGWVGKTAVVTTCAYKSILCWIISWGMYSRQCMDHSVSIDCMWGCF